MDGEIFRTFADTQTQTGRINEQPKRYTDMKQTHLHLVYVQSLKPFCHIQFNKRATDPNCSQSNLCTPVHSRDVHISKAKYTQSNVPCKEEPKDTNPAGMSR